MKHIPTLSGLILGLLFISAAVMVLFNLGPRPEPPPEGSPPAHFMAALAPTGYLTFVKICELAGGILVAIPRTRNFGLLVLGPIILNIIAFHAFITAGAGLFSPMLIGICLLAAYLLWVERRAFLGLIQRSQPRTP